MSVLFDCFLSKVGTGGSRVCVGGGFGLTLSWNQHSKIIMLILGLLQGVREGKIDWIFNFEESQTLSTGLKGMCKNLAVSDWVF